MSVRADQSAAAANPTIGALSTDVVDVANGMEDAALGGDSTLANANFPLKRNVCVVIRASLNDFCLQKTKATWSPSPEALKQIFQQRKFTNLAGAAEQQGDLRSIVLHNLKLAHVKSSFPFSVGARVTGVDDVTFSATGEPYSTIVLPNSESIAGKCLQADDTELAYEFAKKFPVRFASRFADHVASGVFECVFSLSLSRISLTGLHQQQPAHQQRARGEGPSLRSRGRGALLTLSPRNRPRGLRQLVAASIDAHRPHRVSLSHS